MYLVQYDLLSSMFCGRNYQMESLEGVHGFSTNVFSVEQLKYASAKFLKLFLLNFSERYIDLNEKLV